ncbi:MAG: hypothetical protein CL489_06880 [Acidobacteria bacterium]|nr:hypothetical protein [Acidobacteriota bacterium]
MSWRSIDQDAARRRPHNPGEQRLLTLRVGAPLSNAEAREHVRRGNHAARRKQALRLAIWAPVGFVRAAVDLARAVWSR